MSVTVRRADVRRERRAMVDVLVRELEGWTDDRKYDWLYLENPFGEACCWVLEDTEGVIAGVSAAFPREVRLGEKALRAWVLGDFCVASRLRSLGPAMKLQRPAFTAVDEGEVDLWYDFPSRVMMAVHQRLGARDGGELARFAYLLRVDDQVAQRVASPVVAKGLSAVGNALLSSREALVSKQSELTVSPLDTDFTASSPAPGKHISLVRSVPYLNWRYRANPLGNPSVLSASGSGASIVFREDRQIVTILDLLGVDDERIFSSLVRAVIDGARAKGASRVDVSLSERHPWVDAFVALGFRKRETVPFVAHARPGLSFEGFFWSLMSGDRDLY